MYTGCAKCTCAAVRAHSRTTGMLASEVGAARAAMGTGSRTRSWKVLALRHTHPDRRVLAAGSPAASAGTRTEQARPTGQAGAERPHARLQHTCRQESGWSKPPVAQGDASSVQNPVQCMHAHNKPDLRGIQAQNTAGILCQTHMHGTCQNQTAVQSCLERANRAFKIWVQSMP